MQHNQGLGGCATCHGSWWILETNLLEISLVPMCAFLIGVQVEKALSHRLIILGDVGLGISVGVTHGDMEQNRRHLILVKSSANLGLVVVGKCDVDVFMLRRQEKPFRVIPNNEREDGKCL